METTFYDASIVKNASTSFMIQGFSLIFSYYTEGNEDQSTVVFGFKWCVIKSNTYAHYWRKNGFRKQIHASQKVEYILFY